MHRKQVVLLSTLCTRQAVSTISR